jgi:hypothetical protein
MKRPGWRQRSARPVKPFTIHVVEGIEETAPIAAKKRGRGRPPDPRTNYIHKQVAMLVHIVERLFPHWKKSKVLAALTGDGRYGGEKSTIFEILRKHRSENLKEASEVTLDVHSTAHRWLLRFLPDLEIRPHPKDRLIKELIDQDAQLDPKQLDLSGE